MKDLVLFYNLTSAVPLQSGKEKCQREVLNITWSPGACSVPVSLTSSSLRSHHRSPPEATGCVLTKAFVPFTSGHRGSSWNYFRKIELFEKTNACYWQLTISLIQADAYWNCQVLSNHFHCSHSRREDSHRNRHSNPLSNQTTEFQWPFSRERETATGMMKHVLLVYTGGDVIPLLCLPTISPWQIVFQALCACVWMFQLSVYHHDSLWLTVIDISSEKLMQR